MLTEEQIDFLEGRIANLYQELEKETIADIARRIKKTGRYTETAELQARALREMGYSPDKIRMEAFKILSADTKYITFVGQNTIEYKRFVKSQIKQTEQSAKAIGNELIAQAGDMAFAYDLRYWENNGKWLHKSSAIARLINDMAKRTEGNLANITKSMGFKGSSGFTALKDVYQHQLDLALIKTLSGAYSYDQAVIDCVKELSHSGLRTVSYQSGKAYQIDSVARMCVRTASNQLAGEISFENCKSSGEDLVEVSEHWGARPSHQEWQGKIYSLSGRSRKYGDFYEETHYGDVDGLCGVNCRHTFFPFFDGISEPTKWEPEPAPTEYNGKTYTYTEATQEQRRQERAIRATKREINAMRSIKAPANEISDLESKLKYQTDKYHKFSKAVDIRPKDGRLRVCAGSIIRENKQIAYRKKKISESIFETFNFSKGDSIRPKTIMKNMKKSSIGNEVLKYLQNNNVKVKLCYGVDNPNNLYGFYDPFDDEITVFCDVTKTVEHTAEVVIHEATHRKLGAKGTFEEEVKCFEAEVLHRNGKLTEHEKRDIIKLVEELYPELKSR